MNQQLFCDILQVNQDANEDEIKKAYRKLARKNHPDFFDQEYKEIQQMKMIQINEAYRFLIRNHKQSKGQTSGTTGEKVYNYNETWEKHQKDRLNNLNASTDVGQHKDPAYAYYKQGFINFSKGLHGIMADTPYKIKTDITSLKEWASGSLIYFRKAHSYFSRVVEDHPESIWTIDANEKLNRIENFNVLYKRILLNIKRKLEPGK